MENIFDIEGFLSSLQVMLFGMVGIFVVIGIIAVLVFVLNKAFSGKRKNDNGKDK